MAMEKAQEITTNFDILSSEIFGNTVDDIQA
jgi:hypothetical protein